MLLDGCLIQRDKTAFGTNPSVDGNRALRTRRCTNVTFRNGTMEQVSYGMEFLESVNVAVTDSVLRMVQIDGIRGEFITGLAIQRCVFRDWLGYDNAIIHSDMIQLYTDNGWGPTTNVLIEDNLFIDRDASKLAKQIVFMNNAGNLTPAGDAFTIRGNIFDVTTTDGIKLEDVDNLTIDQNTLLFPAICRPSGDYLANTTVSNTLAFQFQGVTNPTGSAVLGPPGSSLGKPDDPDRFLANLAEFRRTDDPRHLVPLTGAGAQVDGLSLYRDAFDWTRAGDLTIRRTDTGEIVHQESGLTGTRSISYQGIEFNTENKDPLLHSSPTGETVDLNDTELPAVEWSFTVTMRDTAATVDWSIGNRTGFANMRQLDNRLVLEDKSNGYNAAQVTISTGQVVEIRWLFDGANNVSKFVVDDVEVLSTPNNSVTPATEANWYTNAADATDLLIHVPQAA